MHIKIYMECKKQPTKSLQRAVWVNVKNYRLVKKYQEVKLGQSQTLRPKYKVVFKQTPGVA